jgi:hypothetical protein
MACVKKYSRELIYNPELFIYTPISSSGDKEEGQDQQNSQRSSTIEEVEEIGAKCSAMNSALSRTESLCVQEEVDAYTVAYAGCIADFQDRPEAYKLAVDFCAPGGKVHLTCRQLFNNGNVPPKNWWLGPQPYNDEEVKELGTPIPAGRTAPNEQGQTEALFYGYIPDYEYLRSAELSACSSGDARFWDENSWMNTENGYNVAQCVKYTNKKYDQLAAKQKAAREAAKAHRNKS